MSVTLNLTHTFSTRVVYSSKEVAEIREELASQLAMAEKADLSKLSPKKRAEIKAGLKVMTLASTYSDDDLILFCTKEAIKNGVAEDLRKELEQINVTRLSPVKTELVRSFEPKSALERACDCNACFECRLARGGSDE